jgi:hypothetical protein
MFHAHFLPIPRPSTGNCFLGFYETGKFKELYKIEEEVGGVPGYPERIRGRFGAEPWEICGGSVVHLGQNLVPFLTSILVPFFTDFSFTLNAVPALLKCDFGPLFEDSSNSASKVDFIQCPPY